MTTKNFSDLIDGLDAIVRSCEKIKTALQREVSECTSGKQMPLIEPEETIRLEEALRPDDSTRVNIADTLKPTRNTKHGKLGFIDIAKVRDKYGIDVSIMELREVCDMLGIQHRRVGHNTYIHYWNADTLRKFYNLDHD